MFGQLLATLALRRSFVLSQTTSARDVHSTGFDEARELGKDLLEAMTLQLQHFLVNCSANILCKFAEENDKPCVCVFASSLLRDNCCCLLLLLFNVVVVW